MVGAVFALLKMHQPRGLTVPITLPFAQHTNSTPPVRIENERERRKPLARNVVQDTPGAKAFGSNLVNIQNARAAAPRWTQHSYICAFPCQ